MSFHNADELTYYTLDLFEMPGIVHGFYTRHGGISPEPWASLNLATSVGDTRENIIENRARIFKSAGRQVESIYDVWQVHSVDAICTDIPRPLDTPPIKADTILTDRPEITLFMRFADCVPILLHDPVKKVIGIVHAGWQGTVKKACQVAVEAMQDRYQSNSADVLAGIGPSIGPHHYPVGPDVIQQVREAFGEDASGLLDGSNGQPHFDLWEANRLTLEQCGVRHQHIQVSGMCTACHTEDWFSHRGEHGKTGRFGALLAMKD